MKEYEFRPTKVVENWYKPNDGTRTLLESVVSPEVTKALSDFKKAGGSKDAILIGGLAISYWGIPRATMDADFLFLSRTDIPMYVEGFKKVRDHAFQHKETHVEIEVLDPPYINLPEHVAKMVLDTAIDSGGIKIASKSALVAMKLFRLKRYDQGDIEQLVSVGDIDLKPFNLPQQLLDKFAEIVHNM
jgi:hypothetical protein